MKPRKCPVADVAVAIRGGMPDLGSSFAGYGLLIESIARDVIRDRSERIWHPLLQPIDSAADIRPNKILA
jgi:hypothetical protein